MSTWPRSHSAIAARRRASVYGGPAPTQPRHASPKPVKNASPAGKTGDGERQQPAESLGIDQKGVADPVEPARKYPKPNHQPATPPQPPLAPRRPSSSQTSNGKVTNSTGQTLRGPSPTSMRAGENAISAPPAPGQNDRVGEAGQRHAGCRLSKFGGRAPILRARRVVICNAGGVGAAGPHAVRRACAVRADARRPQRGDPHPLHAPRIGIEHFDLEHPDPDQFAAHRHRPTRVTR